jgi:hypothetical protein
MAMVQAVIADVLVTHAVVKHEKRALWVVAGTHLSGDEPPKIGLWSCDFEIIKQADQVRDIITFHVTI